MGTTLRDCLYQCTSNSCWVCLIEGRFLVGGGMKSGGKSAWRRKADAAQVFKLSNYWRYVKGSLIQQHPEIHDWNRGDGLKLLDEEHKRLQKEGIVKYIEIKPIPEWVNV